MPRKPAPKKSDKLTPAEIKSLASALIDSSENVFTICQSLFKKKVGEEVFDLLRKQKKMFRCENCLMWKGLAEESETVFDWCKECEDEESEDSEESAADEGEEDED